MPDNGRCDSTWTNQKAKDVATGFQQSFDCDNPADNKVCYYGRSGGQNADDACVLGGLNRLSTGVAAGYNNLFGGSTIICIEHDNFFENGDSWHVSGSKIYIPYLKNHIDLSFSPEALSTSWCGGEDLPTIGNFMYRWLVMFQDHKWFDNYCTYVQKCSGTPPCDDEQFTQRGTSPDLETFRISLRKNGVLGALITVKFFYGNFSPSFTGNFYDHFCFLRDDGNADTSEVGIDADDLQDLDVFVSCKYGEDKPYVWFQPHARDILNAAFVILNEYVDKFDIPGHLGTVSSPESPNISTWIHNETFNGTKPPDDPLPAQPVVRGTASFYPEHEGFGIPITLRGLMDSRIRLDTFLYVIGVNTYMDMHIERKTDGTAPLAANMTGTLHLLMRLGVKMPPDAWLNPYAKFMGNPGPQEQNFQTNHTAISLGSEEVSLDIPAAPAALPLGVPGAHRPIGHVVIVVSLIGDFDTDAKNVALYINDNDGSGDVLLDTLFDNSRENIGCGTLGQGLKLEVGLDWTTWNTYANGSNEVTLKIVASASFDPENCEGDLGSFGKISVSYMANNTENIWDLRVKDEETGLEHKTERLIAVGPNGERVPMQKRDGSMFYHQLWEGLATTKNLSRSPNNFKLGSPLSSGCCPVWTAIEAAVMWGRTDDNGGWDNKAGEFTVLPQRFEGSVTFDIDGDSC